MVSLDLCSSLMKMMRIFKKHHRYLKVSLHLGWFDLFLILRAHWSTRWWKHSLNCYFHLPRPSKDPRLWVHCRGPCRGSFIIQVFSLEILHLHISFIIFFFYYRLTRDHNWVGCGLTSDHLYERTPCEYCKGHCRGSFPSQDFPHENVSFPYQLCSALFLLRPQTKPGWFWQIVFFF